MPDYLEQTFRDVGPFLLQLVAALVVLVAGYVLAKILARLVRKGLERTTLDKRIGKMLAGEKEQTLKVADYAARGVFYVVMVLVLVAFLQVLGLTFVTEPLNRFLNTIFAFIPQLVAAAVLVLLAYITSRLLRLLTQRALKAARVDERVRQQMGGEGSTVETAADQDAAVPPRPSIADTVGTAVYYLIWLLFLPAILNALALQGLLRPVENMVNEALNILPNLLAAALILIIGYFVARLVRQITVSLLVAIGTDRLAERIRLTNVLGKQQLSEVIGTIVHVLILIPVLIAALNALAIDAVTAPASRMLDLILTALPQLFAAALVVIIAYVVGRLVAGLVSNVLAGIGFNRFLERLGLIRNADEAEAEHRLPSDYAGTLVLVGVMLFASMEAANLLGFLSLTSLLSEFLVFLGAVLIALVIFALGLYLAGLAYRSVRDSGIEQAATLAVAARVSIIVLAGAMALRQMGLADSIINLAFGLILGAIAVAAAIAFGWGGRDLARTKLEELVAANGRAPQQRRAAPQEPTPTRPAADDGDAATGDEA